MLPEGLNNNDETTIFTLTSEIQETSNHLRKYNYPMIITLFKLQSLTYDICSSTSSVKFWN